MTRGSITLKQLLNSIDTNAYEVVKVEQRLKGDTVNAITVKCKNCGYVSKMNIFNMRAAYHNVMNNKLCKNC